MKKTLKSTITFFSIIGLLSAFLLQAIPTYAKSPVEDFTQFKQNEYVDAEIVTVNPDGSITYGTDPDSGLSLLDYSRAGYHYGEDELPDVPVVKTIEPGDLKDHTRLIQSAIYEVSALPLEQRGAILLKAGVYVISDHILIRESGIVLRGEGEGANGTVIYDARTSLNYASVYLQGSASFLSGQTTYKIHGETLCDITDEKVLVGNPTLHLSDEAIKKFSVGDEVVLTFSPNEKWVEALGMDNLKTPWDPKNYVMSYERVIMAIDGNEVTLDNSAAMTIDKALGSVTFAKKTDTGRISESGVEGIRFQSYYNASSSDDEQHAWRAVSTWNAKDCWVRNITAINYAKSCVEVATGSRNVTVDRCSFIEPISTVGGERRYSFLICEHAANTLIQNCYSNSGRHDFAIGAFTLGPNVYYNCVTADSFDSSETHNNWGTGALFDNVFCVGTDRIGTLQSKNNGNSGTNHGWMGANTVFWNCLSNRIVIAKPQTEQNYAIGSYGIYAELAATKDSYLGGFVHPDVTPENYPEGKAEEGSPLCGNGYIESYFNPVNPSSLYQAQLAYRVSGNATLDITPISPILNYPRYDQTSMTGEIEVAGFCDVNADMLYVYVDGDRVYELDCSDMTSFSISIPVSAGYHSVSVSQRIAGYESARTPDRYVFISTDEGVKPMPNIIKYLASIGHEPAIKELEYRESMMMFYRDGVDSAKAGVDTAYAALVEALVSLEASLSEGNVAPAKESLKKMSDNLSALNMSLSKIDNYFKMAESYNCYEEYMLPMMRAQADAVQLKSNSAILLARAEREIADGRVEDYDYTVELENGGPIETAPPETETVTEPETEPETDTEAAPPNSRGGCKSAVSFVLPAIIMIAVLPLVLRKRREV